MSPSEQKWKRSDSVIAAHYRSGFGFHIPQHGTLIALQLLNREAVAPFAVINYWLNATGSSDNEVTLSLSFGVSPFADIVQSIAADRRYPGDGGERERERRRVQYVL